jgi:hypothetical protein
MGKRWHPMKKLSPWRRMAIGMWKPPADPTIYGHEAFDVTDALPYLEELSERSGVKVTPTALVIKCFADVFGAHPALNVIIVNGRIQQRESVDVFCQVAIIPDAGSADLSGVKLDGVDEMSLVEIAAKLQKKAAKVRCGEDEDVERSKQTIAWVPTWLMLWIIKLFDFLTFNVPFDLDAIGVRSDPFGSFMVSSIAPLGLQLGYAPLVPASRCPYVVLPGASFEAPRVVDGEIVVRTVMKVAGTFDHRVFDGFQIAMILKGFKERFTEPRLFYDENGAVFAERGENEVGE